MDAQALTPRVVRRLYGSHTKCARRSERSLVCDLSRQKQIYDLGIPASPRYANRRRSSRAEERSHRKSRHITTPMPILSITSNRTTFSTVHPPFYEAGSQAAVTPRNAAGFHSCLRRPWNPWHTASLRHLLPHGGLRKVRFPRSRATTFRALRTPSTTRHPPQALLHRPPICYPAHALRKRDVAMTVRSGRSARLQDVNELGWEEVQSSAPWGTGRSHSFR